MTRLQRAVVLCRLIDRLREHGSWSGVTHIQKAVFVLQECYNAPLGYEFVLYKHGPFSFDLNVDLTQLRADGVLSLEVMPPPYGPKLKPSNYAEAIRKRFAETDKMYEKSTQSIAEFFRDKPVGELERIGTALFVWREDPSGSATKRWQRLRALKPHVSAAHAKSAVTAVDEFRQLADTK